VISNFGHLISLAFLLTFSVHAYLVLSDTRPKKYVLSSLAMLNILMAIISMTCIADIKDLTYVVSSDELIRVTPNAQLDTSDELRLYNVYWESKTPFGNILTSHKLPMIVE
jgi:hypothetical protein